MRDDSGVTLGDYLAVLRRRAGIILGAVAFATIAAFLYSAHQPRRYAASAEVLLNQTTQVASGGQALNAPDAARYDETQARVAVTPLLAQRVIAASRVHDLTGEQLLHETNISADPNSDILTFRVTDPSGPRAIELANDYANQFVVYRRQLDTGAVRRSLTGVDQHLQRLSSRLNAAVKTGSPAVASLRYKVNQLSIEDQDLRGFLATTGGSATVFNGARTFAQTQPKVFRDTVIGALLGLVLGVTLAFAAEGLDTRVRRSEDVATELGLALLGRIPAFPRGLRRAGGLVMLTDQHRAYAEPYRRLAVSLKYVCRTRRLSTVLVTSAVKAEGKSTTAANVAVACARSGMRVALADLDLHNPAVHRLFGVSQTPGFAGVATGEATLDEAIVQIRVDLAGGTVVEAPSNGHREYPAAAPAEVGGTLDLLPAGVPLYDPGEFLQTTPVAQLLEALAERVDLLLVDSPPVLPVSDVLTLSEDVDGILIVARSKVLTTHALDDLKLQLEALRAPAVGFAFISGSRAAGYGAYNYGYGYGEQESGRFARLRRPAPPPRPIITSVPDADRGGE